MEEPLGAGRLDGASAKRFALAGNATFTVVSKRTGTRFTYRMRQPRADAPHFVRVLNGPDNEGNYAFLGTVFGGAQYRHGKRSRIGTTAPSARAFAWLWPQLASGRLSDDVEFWHEGRCGRCGRKLTVPESIESGIGPKCAEQGLP